MRAGLWGALVFAACEVGCAHEQPFEIVLARELAEASAAPTITQVVELGGVDVPARGQLQPTQGDKVAVVGEGLWLRGTAFGRQPTVFVAGSTTTVLARTADGGIVVRVPTGTAAGAQVLQVRTLAGRAEVKLNVRRYAVVWNAAGQSQWLDASNQAQGPRRFSSPPSATLPQVARLAFSSDGRAAYAVENDSRRLLVIDATAQHGPQMGFALELEGKPVRFLKTAALAPVLVVFRDDDVLVLSTNQAARPPRSRPRTLPREVLEGLPVAVAVSPDGQHLAVALANGNKVALLSLRNRDHAQLLALTSIDDSVQAPPLRDLGFAVEGDVLWALSGTAAEASALGARPTTVTTLALKARGNEATLVVNQKHELQQAEAPTAFGVSRTRPLPSGAAIRRPPSLAQVFVGARLHGQDHGVFAVGALGAALVTNVQGSVLDILIEPLGQLAFASVVAPDGSASLVWLRADGREATPQTLPLWPQETSAGAIRVEVQP